MVLDSWPVMEWLKLREPATTMFDAILDEAKSGRLRLVISTINLGEIYYNCIDVWQQAQADVILADFRELPIEIFHPSQADALRGARIKGLYRGAYGDAFAAVLAMELIAPVATGDPDFLKLRNAGVLTVEWLGK